MSARKGICKTCGWRSEGARLYDWWNVNQVKNVSKTKLDHPCIMPTEVMRNALGVIKDKNVTVVDPFCGSGTTLLAALSLGISTIGIDISEEYCKLALSRIKECGY